VILDLQPWGDRKSKITPRKSAIATSPKKISRRAARS